jgi:hypothetical protein
VLAVTASVLAFRASVLVVTASVLIVTASVLVVTASVLVVTASVLVVTASVLVVTASVLVVTASVLASISAARTAFYRMDVRVFLTPTSSLRQPSGAVSILYLPSLTSSDCQLSILIMPNTTHVLVVLKLPDPIPKLLEYSGHIVQQMTNNLYFPTASSVLTVATANMAALATAQTTARTRAVGAAGDRDLKLVALVATLHTLRGIVQTAADSSPAQAKAIIASSGMSVAAHTPRLKPTLAALMGLTPGLVLVRAKAAAKRAVYEWQYSADGGKTWITIAVTNVADTSVSGLAVGTTYLFRFRSTVRKVVSDWSQTVSLLVH